MKENTIFLIENSLKNFDEDFDQFFNNLSLLFLNQM